MQNPPPVVAFDQKHASEYDQRFAKLSATKDALHLLTAAVLAELPEEARILCVGAGTGAEILYLAEKFPKWTFTAVEPSGAMLDVCRRRAEETGIASRCVFHEGYLESLPPNELFDAGTSILVSHFILARKDRVGFFQGIAERVKPGGLLVTADLGGDMGSDAGRSLREVWFRLMQRADISEEQIQGMRVAYEQNVSLLPLETFAAILEEAGFAAPVQFLQTGLIHAFYAQKALGE